LLLIGLHALIGEQREGLEVLEGHRVDVGRAELEVVGEEDDVAEPAAA